MRLRRNANKQSDATQKGRKPEFIAPAYRKFESSSLQQGVRNELLIDAAPFAGSASLT